MKVSKTVTLESHMVHDHGHEFPNGVGTLRLIELHEQDHREGEWSHDSLALDDHIESGR
jgi:hypothetical protein